MSDLTAESCISDLHQLTTKFTRFSCIVENNERIAQHKKESFREFLPRLLDLAIDLRCFIKANPEFDSLVQHKTPPSDTVDQGSSSSNRTLHSGKRVTQAQSHACARQRDVQAGHLQTGPSPVTRLQDIDRTVCRRAATAVVEVEFPVSSSVAFPEAVITRWLCQNSFCGKVLLIEHVPGHGHRVYFEHFAAAEAYRSFLIDEPLEIPGIGFVVNCVVDFLIPRYVIPAYITRTLVIDADRSDQPLRPWPELVAELFVRFPALNRECRVVPLWTNQLLSANSSIPAGPQGKNARRAFRCQAQRALLIFNSVAAAVAVERVWNVWNASQRLSWPRSTRVHCDYGLDISDVDLQMFQDARLLLATVAGQGLSAEDRATTRDLQLAIRYQRLEAGDCRVSQPREA